VQILVEVAIGYSCPISYLLFFSPLYRKSQRIKRCLCGQVSCV